MRKTSAVSRFLLDAEVSCSVEGEFELSDYGVPRSPVWHELVRTEILWPVEVDGEEYADEQALETKHPGLAAAILEYAAEEGDWS